MADFLDWKEWRKFSFGCSIIRTISMDAKGRAKKTQKNLKKNTWWGILTNRNGYP
jgi:hypothetical protein